jgi:hypothetical protein
MISLDLHYREQLNINSEHAFEEGKADVKETG